MSTEIIAHVGTEKTGTSSIQKHLWSNRIELQNRDWLYLNALGPGPNIKLTACALDYDAKSAVHSSLRIDSEQKLAQHRAEIARLIADEVDECSPETILISDEHLNVHLRNPEQLKRISDYFENAHIGKIVIYLRKQNRFLESILSEGIKNQSILFTGNSGGISAAKLMQLDGKEIPYRFDYLSILNNLSLAFPQAELLVRGYTDDSSTFDSVADFSTLIGLPIEQVENNSVRENKSIPGRVFSSLVELGHYAKHDQESALTKQWRKVIEIASRAFPGRPFRLAEQESQLVMNRFEQQNKELVHQFPSLESVFFGENADTADSDEIVSVDSLEVIDILKKEMPENLAAGLLRIESKLKAKKQATGSTLTGSSPTQQLKEKTMNAEVVETTCPICAGKYNLDVGQEHREGPLCTQCNASGRASAIIHYVCQIAYGNDTPLVNQLPKKSFSVVGLSDGPRYAGLLDEKFTYVNTFYHKEPFLDITAPSADYNNQYDLLISTEVFEHVMGDPLAPFKGAYSILKPGGTLVLTVPFRNKGEHLEHYPGLKSYTSRELPNSKWIADLEFADGTTYTEENPKFHGGPGKTLEVRLYNRVQLLKDLHDSGFVNVDVHDENKPEFGINWGSASRLITATKPVTDALSDSDSSFQGEQILSNVS